MRKQNPLRGRPREEARRSPRLGARGLGDSGELGPGPGHERGEKRGLTSVAVDSVFESL